VPARFISSSPRAMSPASSSIPRPRSSMAYVFNPSWRAPGALFWRG